MSTSSGGLPVGCHLRYEDQERRRSETGSVLDRSRFAEELRGAVLSSQTHRVQTEHGENVSSALASDNLAGMESDAGKVVEARSKEVQYIRDRRVYDKIPRQQVLRKGVEDH